MMIKRNDRTVRRLPAAAAGGLALALVVAAGCSREPDALTVAGSTSFQAVERAWADAFVAAEGGSRLHIENVDSAAAIQAVRSGFAGLGAADFLAPPPETQGLRVIPVARDGIVVIVHPDNAVTNLSRDRIRDIFSGRITLWRDVGGGEGQINCVMRERGSGTRQSFEELTGAATEGVNAVLLETSRAILETVARDTLAVGYVSHIVADARVRQVAIDGIGCSPETMAAGRYPLVRTLNLLSPEPPSPRAAAFLAFVSSPAGRAISVRHELIPVD